MVWLQSLHPSQLCSLLPQAASLASGPLPFLSDLYPKLSSPHVSSREPLNSHLLIFIFRSNQEARSRKLALMWDLDSGPTGLLTSLRLSFLICEMRTAVVVTDWELPTVPGAVPRALHGLAHPFPTTILCLMFRSLLLTAENRHRGVCDWSQVTQLVQQ